MRIQKTNWLILGVITALLITPTGPRLATVILLIVLAATLATIIVCSGARFRQVYRESRRFTRWHLPGQRD